MSARNLIFNKFFFPKVVTIEKPGIIINQFSRRYGGIKSRHRIVYFFEDCIAELQKNTIEKIGKEKTEEMWYKIGKDFGTRYLILGKAKRPPFFLTSDVLYYILNGFKSSGFSVAEKISYNPKKETLILEGRNNILCRKSGVSGYAAGLISAIFSFLHGKNIEAESSKLSLDHLYIIASPKIKEKHRPDILQLIPVKEYDDFNFYIQKIYSKYPSFNDLVKFNRIYIDNESKFCFMGKTIAPVEMGWFGLINHYYSKEKIKSLLNQSIRDTSEKIISDFFKNKDTEDYKMKFIQSMFSAFGWGILHWKKEKGSLIVQLINPPYTCFNPIYVPLVINGFLNHVFKKKFVIKSIDENYKPYSIKIIYI